jgi:hypothetical protein
MLIVAIYTGINNFRREREISSNQLPLNIKYSVFRSAHQMLTVCH